MFILFSLWAVLKICLFMRKFQMVHSGLKMGTRESKMATRAIWNVSFHSTFQNLALLAILDSLLPIFSPSWTILKFFSLKDKFFSLAKEKIKRTKYYFHCVIYLTGGSDKREYFSHDMKFKRHQTNMMDEIIFEIYIFNLSSQKSCIYWNIRSWLSSITIGDRFWETHIRKCK